MSIPIELRRIRFATTKVVPEPINGSNTVSFCLVKSFINHSGSSSGNAALWFLLLHSVARCKTLVGYALSLFNQFEIFFPNPLPTFELSLILSVSERFLSLFFCPITHWNHNFFLVHIEFFILVKLKKPFP